MRGGGVVVCFAVVEGEEEEGGEEGEDEPGGEGNEDDVHEAGCGYWRGEGRVWALEFISLAWERGRVYVQSLLGGCCRAWLF